MRAVSSSSRHPLPAGRWRVRRRPGSVPPFWRKILEVGGAAGYARARDRLLVLEACRIPCRTVCFGGQLCAYVPPLLEQPVNAPRASTRARAKANFFFIFE